MRLATIAATLLTAVSVSTDAAACRCGITGPPLSEASTLETHVIVLATPIATETRTRRSIRLPDNPWGLETELEPSRWWDEKFTMFRVDDPLASDAGDTLELAHPKGVASSCGERITPGLSGLYVFVRKGDVLSLSQCNGGYTLDRVRTFMVTGRDPHPTAADVCGSSFYRVSRMPREEREAHLAKDQKCGDAYTSVLDKLKTLDRNQVRGQLIPILP